MGSWAILTLLQRGYRVRTTLRNQGRANLVRTALAARTAIDERLSFYAADLAKDDGWARAVEGVDYVLHVASPIGQETIGVDIIAPTRDGALRVLKASAAAGVKRVVLTSSGVAARPPREESSGVLADESIWTDLTEKDIDNYTKAKTLAERAAWDFISGSGGRTTLSTVLPVFVQGPVLSKDLASDSTGIVTRMLTGKLPALPRIGLATVDVRDVVDLHLKAMTHPDAGGNRFIANGDFLWMTDIARILRARLGDQAAKVPTRSLPNIVLRLSALLNAEARFAVPLLGQRREFTSAKAEKMLGWQARPVEDTIVEGARSLIQVGLA